MAKPHVLRKGVYSEVLSITYFDWNPPKYKIHAGSYAKPIQWKRYSRCAHGLVQC
jgi:hypothetical protein